MNTRPRFTATRSFRATCRGRISRVVILMTEQVRAPGFAFVLAVAALIVAAWIAFGLWIFNLGPTANAPAPAGVVVVR